MTDQFLRSLDDIKEEQEAILEREMDPDMALLTDFLAGDLSEEQAAEVRARIQKDPDFRDLAQPLLLAAEHGARRVALPRADLDRKWLELRRRIGLPELTNAPPRADDAMAGYRKLLSVDARSARRRVVATIAATILLTSVPVAIITYRNTFARHTGTAWGRTEIVPMSDGSRATLSMGSDLVHLGAAGAPAAETREYTLVGEAAFDVANTGGTPFVVRTQSAFITVTGTRFTVHAYANEPTIVTVQQGTVRVQPRNADGDAFGLQLSVAAGQRARIVQGFPAEIIP